MIRLSLLAPLVMVPGCQPPAPPPAPPAPPSDVNPAELVRLYRDVPGLARETYTGRRVRCLLPARSYAVLPAGVGYLSGLPNAAPPLVFDLAEPPADSGLPLVVTGTCVGATRDGVVRGPGIDFVVRVADATAR